MIEKDKIKPFLLLVVFTLGACFYFWVTSRYPDLGSKATLGGAAPLSGLGFAPFFNIKSDASVWEKLFYGTLNWMEINRRGMTFAFVLSAFVMTLLSLVNIRRAKTAVGNAFAGLVMGAPLGLCVNCSAPVARSMQTSGMRLESMLALLISSPTMNVVVLMMAFTMFPFYLVVQKIVFVLLFVIVIIPLSCRYIFKNETIKNDNNLFDFKNNKIENKEIYSWYEAVGWSVKEYIKNFIRIVVMTGPLMILAGFIGTAIITFMPWQELARADNGISLSANFAVMFGVGIIGALLPAPMAFDVAMSAALLQAGVPIAYVAVFLFTLGSYSIYALIVVWQAISLRVALFLLVVTVALGMMMGLTTGVFEKYYYDKANIVAEESNYYDPIIVRKDTPVTYEIIKEKLKDSAVIFSKYTDYEPVKNIKVERTSFLPIKSAGSGKAFTRIYGEEFGIEQPYRLSYLIDNIPRITTSIATGDVHNDGWEDILLLGDSEVAPNLILYTNVNGKNFIRQEIPEAQDVVLVALIDLDGDNWQDIVYATYEGKNFVIYNEKGEFKEKNKKALGKNFSGTTNSMGFADINKDGKIDVVLGNWSVGPHFVNYSASRDKILLSRENIFEEKELQGMTGETLSTMFWDFNHDGNLDIYIGNDYLLGSISDLILLGDGKGNFNFSDESINKIFLGGQSTMSITAADINNDLSEEYFIGHIAYIGHYLRKMSQIADRQIGINQFCEKEGIPIEKMNKCTQETAFKEAYAKVSNFISDSCESLQKLEYKKMCEMHMAYLRPCTALANFPTPTDELFFKDNTSRYAKLCMKHKEASQESKLGDISMDFRAKHLDSSNESLTNVLLLDKELNEKYADVAKERSVGYGGWTWNAKFADLDNDGWKDLYVTNGYTSTLTLGTKILYRNKGDGYFEDVTKKYGLEDYSNSAAYSYIDFDHDGDMDIISVPLDWSVKFFKNNADQNNNAIQIELQDNDTKNTKGIGAKIVIGYKQGDNTKRQVHFIMASGGYKSFDAPIAHFGLKDLQVVDFIEVQWPDGKNDILRGKFKSGGRYKITRS